MEAKIKPQVLRLGSLLNFEGQPMEVAQINPDNTVRFWREKETGTTCGCFDITKAPIEPIPLSEDWLIRMGLVNGVLENENFKFKVIFYDCWRISYVEKDGYGGSDCYLEGYPKVHELQNFFYSVAGSELTLKDINNIEVK